MTQVQGSRASTCSARVSFLEAGQRFGFLQLVKNGPDLATQDLLKNTNICGPQIFPLDACAGNG